MQPMVEEGLRGLILNFATNKQKETRNGEKKLAMKNLNTLRKTTQIILKKKDNTYVFIIGEVFKRKHAKRRQLAMQ